MSYRRNAGFGEVSRCRLIMVGWLSFAVNLPQHTPRGTTDASELDLLRKAGAFYLGSYIVSH